MFIMIKYIYETVGTVWHLHNESMYRDGAKLTFETSQFEISTDHNLALYKCLYWNSADVISELISLI